MAAALALSLMICLPGCRPGKDSSEKKRATERAGFLDAILPTETAVESALRDSGVFMKGQGAYLAARYGYRSLIPLIRSNAKDSHWYVRYHSLAALHQLNDRGALPDYLDALGDVDSSVRFKALEALSDLGDSAVVPSVIDRLQDSDAYVRAAAAYALGKLKVAEAIPALIKAMSADDRAVVRRETYLALVKITGLDFPPQPEVWSAWWGKQHPQASNPAP